MAFLRDHPAAPRPPSATGSGRSTPSTGCPCSCHRRAAASSLRNGLPPATSPPMGWNSPPTNFSRAPGTPVRTLCSLPGTPTPTLRPPPGIPIGTVHGPPGLGLYSVNHEGSKVNMDEIQQHQQTLRTMILDLMEECSKSRAAPDRSAQFENALKSAVHQLQLPNHSPSLAYRPSAREKSVTALIDGNSLRFDERLLRKGEEGGFEAAALLIDKIDKHVQPNISGVKPSVLITAYVCADIVALAKTLVDSGVIAEPTILYSFVQGFNNYSTWSRFIDGGRQEFESEQRILNDLQYCLRDDRCQQVVLGSTNEIIFRTIFDKLPKDAESTWGQISFVKAGLTEELINSPRYNLTSLGGILSPFKVTYSTFPSDNVAEESRISSASSSPKAAQERSAQQPCNDATENSQNASPNKKSDDSWVNVTKARPSASLKPDVKTAEPLMVKASFMEGARFVLPRDRDGVALNKRNQRLDPLMKYDKVQVESVKNLKICNHHFLLGRCPHNTPDGKSCPHRHEYPATPRELAYLSLVARMSPCRIGSTCRDPTCFYGHVCPAPEGRNIGRCMFGRDCRFNPDLHNIDPRVEKIWRPATAKKKANEAADGGVNK